MRTHLGILPPHLLANPIGTLTERLRRYGQVICKVPHVRFHNTKPQLCFAGNRRKKINLCISSRNIGAGLEGGTA